MNTSFTCFRDLNYLCICEDDHSRAECFGYNSSLDQCDMCRLHGKCIQGGLSNTSDFICVCEHCYKGRHCEFNMEAFGFTLDSLLVSDSKAVKIIYTST